MDLLTIYDSGGNTIQQFYQWDHDVKIYLHYPLSNNIQVHFSNRTMQEAYVLNPKSASASSIYVEVPNKLLTQNVPINIYVQITNSDGTKTIISGRYVVIKRERPNDFVYSDNAEIVSLKAVTSQAEAATSKAATAASNAETAATNAKNQTAKMEQTMASMEQTKSAMDKTKSDMEQSLEDIKSQVSSLSSMIDDAKTSGGVSQIATIEELTEYFYDNSGGYS